MQSSSRGNVVILVAVLAMVIVGFISGVTLVINSGITPTPTPPPNQVLSVTAAPTQVAQVITATKTSAPASAIPSASPTTQVPTTQAPTRVTSLPGSPSLLPFTATSPATTTPTPTTTLTVTPTTSFTTTPTATVTLTPTDYPIPAFKPVGESSLYIPKLSLGHAVPIITLPLVDGTWDVTTLEHNIGHLDQTSWVGDHGNIVLVAHIQLAVKDYGPFLYLNKLEVGDTAVIADNGTLYVYSITNKTTVDPTDVKVTYPTTDPTITLITCTVWDATKGLFAKRLVVTGKRVRVASVSDLK